MEIKWYWWVLAAILVLYLIGRQKNMTLQQEVMCVFSLCGNLTSGDSFGSCQSTFAPGIPEGNTSQGTLPIGAPVMPHCNIIIARRCGIAPRIPQTTAPPVFHAPAALAPAAPTGSVRAPLPSKTTMCLARYDASIYGHFVP
jgi:hypothetical protein